MNRLLPIGSVVKIKNGQATIMIIGYFPKVNEEKIYDYCGCIFPDGIDGEYNIFFNQEDIEKSFFLGYQNQNSLNFTKFLKECAEEKSNIADFEDIIKEKMDKYKNGGKENE